MYKNKNGELNNISGKNIASIRKSKRPVVSQRALADQLQLIGLDLDKNAIQRIECGKRFVTDIELSAFFFYFILPCITNTPAGRNQKNI